MPKVIKTKTEFEGHWYDEYVVVEGEGLSAWNPGAELTSVGHTQQRIDGAERVTGRATYTSDIEYPGMLYGKILRSPHPHAKIKKIEIRRAEKVPGVHTILTYKNIPNIPFYSGQTFILDQTVRYVGDEIACVIGEGEEICEDAIEEIKVDYDLLPFVLDPEEALKPKAPKVQPEGNLFRGNPEIYERGDVQQGFDQSDIVVEDIFKTQTALHNSMEPHGSVALWEGDHLTVWDSTQYIFGVRESLAEYLDLPLDKVRVIKKYMGGGFGSKNRTGKYTVLAALGARITGRPVKIILDRHEENITAGNRPSSTQYLKIGAKKDGTLKVISLKIISGAGAYTVWPAAVGGPARQLYACPNVRTEQYTVLTNTGPMSAFRAPGYVEGTFALESLMDELSRKLRMDPLELRLKNYTEVDQVSGRPYSTKGLREAYERGAEKIGWHKRPGDRMSKKLRGIGMASQIWSGSGGPPAYALVTLNPDGTATVISGTQDIGTGTKTALAQIAAEELGYSIGKVSVEIGDTQAGPYAPISAGSMTLASVGPAVRFAANDARQQLLDVASQVLEVPRESLSIRDGILNSLAQKKQTEVKEVLSHLEDFMIIGRGSRSPNPEKFNVNTFGAQFAEVEVDLETGEVEVKKMVAVHDSGRVINPLTISSQIEGGVLQGLGFGLMEKRVVDQATGVVMSDDLENYKIPTLSDVPDIVTEMLDRPDPHVNNLGSKGVGEPPIIPSAPAIANAIANAIGIRIKELPIPKDKILRALNQK
jgi:xanthine dehydrogenase YagR molybdenum-binding subunit